MATDARIFITLMEKLQLLDLPIGLRVLWAIQLGQVPGSVMSSEPPEWTLMLFPLAKKRFP
jgi:hypothetical protein